MNRKDYIVDTMLEYFRIAREEILTRIKWRDSWLKYQFLVMVVLVALSIKIKIMQFETPESHPELLLLSLPISFVLCALYFVEDNIIGKLSNYAAAICEAERELSCETHTILNWDHSEQLKTYRNDALPKRILAQVVVFIIGPSIITLYPIVNKLVIIDTCSIFWILYLILIICCFVFIIITIINGNILRKNERLEDPKSIIKEFKNNTIKKGQ